ncbi:MAG: aminotransferase class III-fold pyridoxal phosphate-dependent enzyme, partial [Sphingomonadales bacterium]
MHKKPNIPNPLMPAYSRFDVAFDHGVGAYLFDTSGDKYLDFASGIAVTALGHSHPHLVETLKEQGEKLWHTSNLFQIPLQEKLAERLVAATFADTVFFTNSGVEAMECAIKLARKYHSSQGHPERYRIIAFKNAFHGRSLATIAASGKEKLTSGFGPMPDGFDQVPFIDLEALEAAITPETQGWVGFFRLH